MITAANPEIRKAVDTLYELSADEKVLAVYEQRQKAWRDRASQNEGYFMDGIQQGMEQANKKWQNVIAEKDAEISRLRELLKNNGLPA